VVLSGLGKSLSGAVNRLMGRGVVDKKLILELKNDIFRALLDADIQMNLASQMASNLQRRALDEKLPTGISRKDAMINIIYEELAFIMGDRAYTLDLEKGKVNILMLVGIQGSGKTTTVGKLAKYLKQDKWHVGLVCTDTWRPGAYEQLEQLGVKVGVDVYGNPEGKDAIKLASKGIEHFKKEKKNVIIVDTAGRHKEETNLIKEMKKIDKKIKPDEIILVIDGTLGQTANRQARAFADATTIGSIIVTKLDGTAKGGGAISASAETQAPIKFIGVGEDINDLERFDPKGFASRILGLGDIAGILDQVERAQITPDEERAKEMMKGNVSYSDMLELFESMNKFGGIRKLIDKLPGGISHSVDDQMLATSKDSMATFKNIIFSMTSKERNAQVKLGKSRIDRIARGSGVTSDKVRELINQKKMSEKWIKQMMKGGKRRGRGMNQQAFPFNLAGL